MDEYIDGPVSAGLRPFMYSDWIEPTMAAVFRQRRWRALGWGVLGVVFTPELIKLCLPQS